MKNRLSDKDHKAWTRFPKVISIRKKLFQIWNRQLETCSNNSGIYLWTTLLNKRKTNQKLPSFKSSSQSKEVTSLVNSKFPLILHKVSLSTINLPKFLKTKDWRLRRIGIKVKRKKMNCNQMINRAKLAVTLEHNLFLDKNLSK